MEVTLLGTGTPTPSLKRMSSGYMVRIGDDTMIFDCGPGTYHRMMQAGVSATEVTHIFLSHLHYDHCLDYQRFVLTHWDQGVGKVPELKVYGPAPLARINQQLFDRDGVWGPDLSARTENELSIDVYRQRGGFPPRAWPDPQVTEIENGKVIEGRNWSLKVGSVVHVQPQLYCFGFRLESPEGVFVYSGDTGPCAGIEKLATGCDILASMCHYLTGTAPSEGFAAGCMGHMELAELGEKAEVQNLVISHVTTQIDQPGMRERVLREMATIYSGNLFFGEDLMTIPVGAPSPPILD
ncbi:MBL fold metallo-hydrolase [Fodinicurvata fenggangensis]|uniref:MBL fold metallo-hydrolase n=1 Tax=Fodinicurvata fenggangensis TaxID=1121830 RepID=UPI00047E89B8|nr:MBL fold metallo-hydrolase [Fodinicurvata fenggangensis]